jgi:D-glycero-D-manno-heptose 1,7-bisphosphate phosphatase
VGIDAVTPPAVFLDRDGVINRAVTRNGKFSSPTSLADVEILPGVPQALRDLKQAGYALVVITNQPDVARGVTTKALVEAIHADLAARLPLDDIRTCFHDDADGCVCRKPRPGLLLQPPVYDLAASVMVGDRWRDIGAGRAAGCRATILVDYGYDEELRHEPDARVASLAEAANWILQFL